MRRNWFPCRVCGKEHTNPMSSSICQPCGEKEREERVQAERQAALEYEESDFGQFMNLPEDERWQMLFEHMNATDASC